MIPILNISQQNIEGNAYSRIIFQFLDFLGMNVYSTPEAPVTAVAELTIGATLCLLRLVPHMNEDLHAGRWSKKIGTQL